jgi:hypothetical protein
MSIGNAYRMIKKMMFDSRGYLVKNNDAKFAAVLVELNAHTIVHAYFSGEPVCGREREVGWLPETHWPLHEIRVGIRDGSVVNCQGCKDRLPNVLAAEDARLLAIEDSDLRERESFLKRERERFDKKGRRALEKVK